MAIPKIKMTEVAEAAEGIWQACHSVVAVACQLLQAAEAAEGLR